jgi:GT2 family glycosyltransferase
VSDAHPFVSIVVLNYNGKKHLQNCINSVLENAYPNFEVVLVDNASTDGSIQPIRNRYGADPKLQIIQSNINLGYSGGNNLGLSHSRGKYIVFLNNDTTVESDWLIYLVEALEHDSNIGIAQSLIYAMDKKSVLSAGWIFSDYLIKKYALCADKPVDLKFKPIFDVSFVCGASMIIRREILDKMGAFEPSVPFFYDDTLLTLKTRLCGKRAVTVSASKMCHASGATNVWKTYFTTYNLYKANNILVFDIFHKPIDLIKAIIFNTANAASNTFFNVLKRNIAAVSGNINAFAWTLCYFPFIWRNRLEHWTKTAVSPEQLKQGFVRLNLPTAFYLAPSRSSSEILCCALKNYEKTLNEPELK